MELALLAQAKLANLNISNNQIRYDFDGKASDHIYNAPFSIDLTQSKLLYVSAEDNAGNRNLLAKWIDVVAPNTTATQTPASNQNGWSKEDVNIEIKSLDDLSGSGVESLTYSGSGAQIFPEETLSVKEVPFTFPQPSTALDFLAKAQYKGTGTINGSGNYGFMLTAIDGQINGGGGTDKFRIKIWNKTTNVVIYDNQLGSGDNENPTTAIGGSIIIHRQ